MHTAIIEITSLQLFLGHHNAHTYLHIFSLLPDSPLWKLDSASFSPTLQCAQGFLVKAPVRG